MCVVPIYNDQIMLYMHCPLQEDDANMKSKMEDVYNQAEKVHNCVCLQYTCSHHCCQVFCLTSNKLEHITTSL